MDSSKSTPVHREHLRTYLCKKKIIRIKNQAKNCPEVASQSLQLLQLPSCLQRQNDINEGDSIDPIETAGQATREFDPISIDDDIDWFQLSSNHDNVASDVIDEDQNNDRNSIHTIVIDGNDYAYDDINDHLVATKCDDARKKSMIKKSVTLMVKEELGPLLNKLRKSLQGDIHKIIWKTCSNTITTISVPERQPVANDGIEIPFEPEADGKITMANGLRLDHEMLCKASGARTMKKRTNFLIEAMWTPEERSRLCFVEKKLPGYKKIGVVECRKLMNICSELKPKDHLDWGTTKPEERLQLFRRWISCKLKSKKYTGSFKYADNKRKRKEKQSCINSTIDDYDDNDDDDEENDNENNENEKNFENNSYHDRNENAVRWVQSSVSKSVEPQKNVKTPKNFEVCATRLTKSQPFIQNSAGKVDGRISVNITASQKNQLIELLKFTKYESRMNESNAHTWEEIKNLTAINDEQLHRILTPDCSVIVNGNCRLVCIENEYEALTHATTISQRFFGVANKMKKERLVALLNDTYKTEFVDYIFKKYAVLDARDANATGCSWNIDKLLHLRAWKLLASGIISDCESLSLVLKALPYCDIEISEYARFFELYGELVNPSKDENYPFKMTKKRNVLCHMDPEYIVMNNLAIFSD